MAFWTGLLASTTGHQAGAFKGFSLKDILDKDMWEMHERKFPSPRYKEEGLPAPTTAWYKGMGRPEMMGKRVGAAGVVPAEEDQTILRTRQDRLPMAIGRDRPFPMPRRDAGVTTPYPYTDKAWAEISPVPKVPSPGGIPYGGKNPYRRPATLMGPSGRQRVPSLYDPYLSKLRSDQMGAAGFDPLTRRIQESKRGPEEASIAGQYRKGLQDAVGTLGDAFLPPNVMEGGREVWEDLRNFYYPEEDASSFPADKVTKTVTSADPTKFDTSTTTITEKILGPSGHRMGAFKDTAADMWKTIREDDIIKYWMNQFRGN